jgi:hypothetical protein
MTIIYGLFYVVVGVLYLAWCANYQKDFPDMWSPVQPVGFIIIWPILLILSIIRKKKNNITTK